MSGPGIERARELIGQSTNIVVFSGAGLSAESGIPTYRGAGGLWNEYDPDKYANIAYFMRDPSYYWRFFKEVRYPILKQAKPNTGHFAIARLEKLGKCALTITQNIDGLHSEAGQQRVVELHGNTRQFFCIDCSNSLNMDEAYELLSHDLPPRCRCGGLIRPDVVFFGEPLPPGALEDASQAAAECDTFIAVGSSLLVQPAAQLPIFAKQAGARLIIINIGATPLDDIADLVFDASASAILPELAALSG